MTYWYVDTENVGHDFDVLIKSVKKYDRVVFAYSKANPNLPARYLEALANKQVHLLFFECVVGHANAMDFQIVMRMVSDCKTGLAKAYRVYSGDIGFLPPMRAWCEQGYDFALVNPVDHGKETKPIKRDTLVHEVSKLIPKQHVLRVTDLLKEAKGSKDRYHTLLQQDRNWDAKTATRYYKMTKDLLSRWNT